MLLITFWFILGIIGIFILRSLDEDRYDPREVGMSVADGIRALTLVAFGGITLVFALSEIPGTWMDKFKELFEVTVDWLDSIYLIRPRLNMTDIRAIEREEATNDEDEEEDDDTGTDYIDNR